jgi:hypothetical protein
VREIKRSRRTWAVLGVLFLLVPGCTAAADKEEPANADRSAPALQERPTAGGKLPEGTRRVVGERRPPGQKMLGGFGPDNVLVSPGGTTGLLTQKDADAIARECPAVKAAAPVIHARTPATFANKTWIPLFIYGTTPAYLDVRSWQDLAEGAPFTDADVRKGARVCLIGQSIKRELFDNQSPVGKELFLKNVRFEVVGVLGAHGASVLGLDQDDVIVAPWTTIKARVSSSLLTNVNQRPAAGAAADAATTVNTLNQSYPGSKDAVYPAADPLRAVDYPLEKSLTAIDQVLVRARSENDVPAAVRQITDLLRQRHRIQPGQPDDFDTRDMLEIYKALRAADKR